MYTVGHSTRSAHELIELLEQGDVKLVCDVRAFPSSRRHPQFNQTALREHLSAAGISYLHLAGLGGRRTPRPGTANSGWREPAFRAYADHTRSDQFRGALSELEAVAREQSTAVMCAEAVWWRCHRRLIADALVARGWQVEHLGVGDGHALHELTQFAVVEPDGAISYPAPQTTLLGD